MTTATKTKPSLWKSKVAAAKAEFGKWSAEEKRAKARKRKKKK
jgi:hypothetical protein